LIVPEDKKKNIVDGLKGKYGTRLRSNRDTVPLIEGMNPSIEFSLPYVKAINQASYVPEEIVSTAKGLEEGTLKPQETYDQRRARMRVFNMLKNLPTSTGKPLTLDDVPDLVMKMGSKSKDSLGYVIPNDKYKNAHMKHFRNTSYNDQDPWDRAIATHELIHGTAQIGDEGGDSAFAKAISRSLPDSFGYRSPFYKDGKERVFPSWTTNKQNAAKGRTADDFYKSMSNEVYDTYLAANAPVLNKEIMADAKKAAEELPWYARPLAPLIRGKITLPSEHINVEEMHDRNYNAFKKQLESTHKAELSAYEAAQKQKP
jgi:hypothetical protein